MPGDVIAMWKPSGLGKKIRNGEFWGHAGAIADAHRLLRNPFPRWSAGWWNQRKMMLVVVVRAHLSASHFASAKGGLVWQMRSFWHFLRALWYALEMRFVKSLHGMEVTELIYYIELMQRMHMFRASSEAINMLAWRVEREPTENHTALCDIARAMQAALRGKFKTANHIFRDVEKYVASCDPYVQLRYYVARGDVSVLARSPELDLYAKAIGVASGYNYAARLFILEKKYESLSRKYPV